jgi:hypothetical protein
MKIKRFNEEIDNSKLLEFYNEYKNLFVGEYDSGDLYDTIGDLCVQHYMTKQEVKQVLDTFDCSFDMDKLLKETYDNWIDDEINKFSDSKIISAGIYKTVVVGIVGTSAGYLQTGVIEIVVVVGFAINGNGCIDRAAAARAGISCAAAQCQLQQRH